MGSSDALPDWRQNFQLLVTSFGVGSYENIQFYSQKFVDESRRELVALRNISDKLHEIILPNAAISARLLIENRGGKSITFNPNFALHFKDPSLSISPILLRAGPEQNKKKNPFSLSADGGFAINIPNGTGEEEGKMVQVKPFLPDPDSYPYINVPPGEIKEVSVTGSMPLGKTTKDLLTMYQSKLLRFTVVGSTVTGTRIESTITNFSEQVGGDEQKLLQAN